MTLCDSHIHVVGPPDGMVAHRTYTPGPAPLEALEAVAEPAGVGRFVVVQPSFYGTDNRVTLAALDALGARGRGVAVIDPAVVDDAELADMHRRGVRGLRINLYSTLAQQDARPLDGVFGAMAAVAARMGWHVEVLAAMAVLARHADMLAAAAAPVVIDHFGLYAGHGPESAAAQAVLNLLRREHIWMKLSAPYRSEADALAVQGDAGWTRALLATAPSRCVWGSDWPHTPAHSEQTGHGVGLAYRALDYGEVVRGFRAAVGDAGLADAVMGGNAGRLYGF